MSKQTVISASIVLFHEDEKILQKTIDSFLATNLIKQLFLIDNSTTDTLRNKFSHPEITYIKTKTNLGFGKAHNVVLEKLQSQYHLILNPDIQFEPQVIPNLIHQLKNEKEVSFITPKVINLDGSLQQVCRKHPTPKEMISRRLKINKNLVKTHTYQDKNLEKPFYPAFIHGCFMLFKTADFKILKGFDERYFLYLEDADICKTIEKSGKKIMYYPLEEIVHLHRKASAKSIKLLKHHLISAIKYFKKWRF